MQVSKGTNLAPRGRTDEPDASTEIVPSHGTCGALTHGLHTTASPPSHAFHGRGPQLHQPRRTELQCFSEDPPPPSILSVGYAYTISGRPLRCRIVGGGEEPSPLTCGPECPADVESVRNPIATFPPRTEPYRPCQTRDFEYRRNA